jgi:hypothetical protein
MNVRFQSAAPVTIMSATMETSLVLSAKPAISDTKVCVIVYLLPAVVLAL